MKNDTIHLVPDLGLSFQDRIDILFHEIEMAVMWDRPSILFAIYKSDLIRDEVNTSLNERLKTITQKTHLIRINSKDHFDFLSQLSLLPDLSQIVLLIDGFNWECGPEGVGVLNEFNKHREYFIDKNIRAIFWLFENEVSGFAANATECWNLRHRVVEFVDAPQQENNQSQSFESLWQASNDPSAGEPGSDDFHEKFNLPSDEKGSASHADALLRLGILFWREGKLSRSLKYIQESAGLSVRLASRSLQAQCQNALALVHSEIGNVNDAISAYRSAISLSPESGFLWNNLGQLLAKNGRNEEAIDAYKNALACSSQDFLSWDGIGQVHINLGAYQEAISAFEKALKIAPYYEFSWAGLGKAYLKSRDLDKAEESLRKAVEINANVTDAWTDLGICLVQQTREPDAIAILNKAVEVNPQSAEIWDELGKVHLQRQNFADSISAFQKVISLNPHCREAYIKLAFALFQIGDYETSAVFYENAILQFSDQKTLATLWIRLGDTYQQMKNYEKAIAAYEQSDQFQKECNQSNGPENVLIENLNTEIIQVLKIEENDSLVERGEEMNDANHIFDMKTAAEWNEHGNSHLRAGAYNDAIVAYTKAIEMAPNECWPYIQNLAQVHYQKGKARGKLTVGQIEDPDVWEGEEEANPASLLGYDALSNPERSNEVEEPRLEKLNRNSEISHPSLNPKMENVQTSISNPSQSCSNPENETSSDLKDDPLLENAIIGNTGVEVPQNGETGTIVKEHYNFAPQLADTTPQNSIDWNELGNSYTIAKKFEPAIEAYKKAIEMNPKFGQPYSNLGFIYYRLGKYEVAVLLYKKSIDLLDAQEDKAISWNRLGDAYRRLGDYGNSLAAYQHASEIGPAVSPVMARARATLLENIVEG